MDRREFLRFFLFGSLLSWFRKRIPIAKDIRLREAKFWKVERS